MKLFINDKNGYDELRIYEEEKVLIFVIIKTAKSNKKNCETTKQNGMLRIKMKNK